MSFKSKLAAGAAVFAIAGGTFGIAGTLSASAATPPCGHNCVDLYTQKFGPDFFVDIYRTKAAAGQEVILSRGSNSNRGEDFTYRFEGTVKSFYKARLVSAAFNKTYGRDQAFELQYAPYGVNSGFCVGTLPGNARAGYKIRLERCGAGASTVWAIDTADRVGNYAPLINGSDTNTSDPLVLTYPAGYPTDMPPPWLNVQPLHTFSNGSVFDNQEWSAKLGVLN